MRKNVISQMFVPNIMFQLTEQEAPMLKSIAIVCSKLNDGLSEEQISGYTQ
jgi:hypothetical protein